MIGIVYYPQVLSTLCLRYACRWNAPCMPLKCSPAQCFLPSKLIVSSAPNLRLIIFYSCCLHSVQFWALQYNGKFSLSDDLWITGVALAGTLCGQVLIQVLHYASKVWTNFVFSSADQYLHSCRSHLAYAYLHYMTTNLLFSEAHQSSAFSSSLYSLDSRAARIFEIHLGYTHCAG